MDEKSGVRAIRFLRDRLIGVAMRGDLEEWPAWAVAPAWWAVERLTRRVEASK